jgi:hypothetical protein
LIRFNKGVIELKATPIIRKGNPNGKSQQPRTDSHKNKDYAKAQNKAKEMSKYGKATSNTFRLKYFRPTQASQIYRY